MPRLTYILEREDLEDTIEFGSVSWDLRDLKSSIKVEGSATFSPSQLYSQSKHIIEDSDLIHCSTEWILEFLYRMTNEERLRTKKMVLREGESYAVFYDPVRIAVSPPPSRNELMAYLSMMRREGMIEGAVDDEHQAMKALEMAIYCCHLS